MTGQGRPRADQVPDWRRLSPRMLVIHPVQHLMQSLPALIGVLIAGSTSGQAWWGLAFAAIPVLLGVLRWVTTSYRISPRQVQVRRGLLRRRVLTVPRDRIRTVDVSASGLHRVLGMARVTIGTGLSDRRRADGLRLDALTAPAATELRTELLDRRPAATPAPGPAPAAAPAADAAGTELARLEPGWIRYAPFTLSGLVTVGVVAGFCWRVLNETHVDPTRSTATRRLADAALHTPVPLLVAEAVVVLAVLAAAASTAGYLLAFWRFRLTRLPGHSLHVTRGLVTTRATTIEERRLRGVEYSEPLPLRAVRGARCVAIATGLRVGRGAERGGSLLLPPAPRAEALRVAAAVLGDARPFTAPLRAHGRRAVRRRYTRALLPCALLLAATVLLWWAAALPGWVPVLALAVGTAAVPLAADRAASLGHTLVGGMLVGRRGSLVRRRYTLPTDGIIGVTLRRSFFQRRAGLTTMTATTAGGAQAYPVPDLPDATATRLADDCLSGRLTPFRCTVDATATPADCPASDPAPAGPTHRMR